MSTEYDDVLTNQPVVIDNVRRPRCARVQATDRLSGPLGLWHCEGWLCRTRPPEMFLSVLVRLHG
jgi:hypothetical protein